MADAQNSARLIDRWAGALLARYIRFVRRTSSNVEEMDAIVADSVKHHPCIVAMWHGEFLLLPLIKPPDRPTDIMLARHTDAAFLGEALKSFDMQLIRGAGAAGRAKDRGGSHAYRSAIQALREGRGVGMTADVPGGQARKAGLGIVMAAKQSGKPILPVAIATKRYVALNTWSRMTVNLPYSRLGFADGPARACAARGEHRGARRLPAGCRGWLERSDRAGLRPCRLRSDAGHARRARAPAPSSPAGASRPIARSPAWHGRSRPCCSACARGAARRSRSGSMSGWANRALPGRWAA